MSSFVVEPRGYALSSRDADEVSNGVYTFSEFQYLSRPPPPGLIYQTLSVRFSCLNGFYTVTEANNSLAIDMTLLTLPIGWYSATSLCAAVQTLVRTLRAEATCTYNPTTGRITLTDQYNLTILGAPATTCGALLGMLPDRTYSGRSSWTFEGLADMQPTKSILVSCNLSTQNRRVHNSACYLASIPLNAPPGGLISYEGGTESILLAAPPNNLQLTFQNQAGAPLVFQTEWDMVLTHTLYMAPSLYAPQVSPETMAMLGIAVPVPMYGAVTGESAPPRL